LLGLQQVRTRIENNLHYLPTCPITGVEERKMHHSTINNVIEGFGHLPYEEKEYVAEILRKQLAEERRERLFHRVAEAKENYYKGDVKRGNIEDLRKDLEND